MRANKRNSPLLIGSVSALLFILAIRTHYPLLIIVSVIGIGITYTRFRKNYIDYRRQMAKRKRQSGAIEVETNEVKDLEDRNV